jgi:predicted HD superfamily hydrolase involved in NAD metabolism
MLLEIDEYKKKLKEKYALSNSPRAEARYNHSLSVGKKAVEIAKTFNFDVDLKKIEIAGILHDYAKFETMYKFIEIVAEYNLDFNILKENPKILHALLGPYIVNKELGITDKEILNAIKYHATGALDMDIYAEILYVADVAEDLRDGEGFTKVKEYSKTDFKKAIIEKIEFSLRKNDTELNRKLLKKYTEV